MPLQKGKSKAAFRANVSELIRSGRPRDQSLAIAYRVQREGRKRKYQSGGEVEDYLLSPQSAAEAAAARTRQSVIPAEGRSSGPMTQLVEDVMIPKTPLDVGLMVAGGPFGRMVKAGAMGLGAALTSDTAEAGPLGKITRSLFRAPQRAVEGINAAAVRIGDKVYSGITHADALESAARELGRPADDILNGLNASGRQHELGGFLTSEGRFVDRNEATKLAVAGRQVRNLNDVRDERGHLSLPLHAGDLRQPERSSIDWLVEQANKPKYAGGGMVNRILNNATTAQGLGHTWTGDAKAFGNLTQREPPVEHGYGGLDAPSRGIMMEAMRPMLHNGEVRRPIVSPIPVDVMNILAGEKGPSEGRAHNLSMFLDKFSSMRGDSVPFGVERAASTISPIADATAKHLGVSGLIGRGPREFSPTDFADKRHLLGSDVEVGNPWGASYQEPSGFADGGMISRLPEQYAEIGASNIEDRRENDPTLYQLGIQALKQRAKGKHARGRMGADMGSAEIVDMMVPRKYAAGGAMDSPYSKVAAQIQAPHSGYIPGPTGGRTDAVPMKVRQKSYVIPSHVVSGLGEGNSAAGAAKLDNMFSGAPYGASTPKIKGRALKSAKIIRQKFQDGGMVDTEPPAEIVASDGEYVVGPEQIAAIGGGDIEFGFEVLDKLVEQVTKKTAKTLTRLPKPKQR